MGSRGIALGGAYGALASDFSANYYNPAGLATGDDLRLEVGYLWVDPSLELNGGDLDVDGVHGLQGGLVLPGRLFGHRVGLSLAIYLPDDRLTRVRALPERQPRFALYDNRPQRIVLTTSAAFEAVPDLLYLGLGLTYLSDTGGRLDIAGVVDLQDAGGTTLISGVDVTFEAVRYASAGLLLTPGDHLRVGVTFRDAFDLALDIGLVVRGDIVIDGASEAPSTIVEDAALTVISRNSNLFSPRQLALSFAWVEPTWTVACDLTWLQWSGFESPTSHLTVELDAGTLPLSIPKTPPPGPPGFHDILVPRFGAEVTVVDTPQVGLTLRAGYFYEPSPAPAQPGRTNYVDSDKHGLSFGLGLRLSELTDVFPKPLLLDAALLWIALPARTYTKNDPADPVGDYVASGSFVGFSTTLSFLF
ncbi:MAG: hypothetical protein CVU56_25745 [Deltaproteobacteria bacterium HGW-Deltaproteobacteria-14]|nr:MAG: hypothetical protein CVU56_25745 [Deltaproteobacteria bacterium HGW-Deltaproteobacteria-14]